ncbi:NAC domain-containing protein 73 [Amborella trichopoda]|uniref:NAC domain-containing protein n=1 Tax=Amborella trichopoda TaxID=13333 RepID=W1PVI8_AMBTC|nr:NAC domain-containing protein 73 [Amborella trichopoda]ERN14042.1 hypothetical protein AMTR_s00021p00209320 [Amborella trichopoda]|eukprot:XP_006852575.1 NAC domain-containing protein 73 [Amborella trichopoda]
MTWCRGEERDGRREEADQLIDGGGGAGAEHSQQQEQEEGEGGERSSCPSCGHPIPSSQKQAIQNLPGLPAGVKFDPTDQELLEHLEGKVRADSMKLHPLIDEFIPTLDGESGICSTHPERLPGVRRDGHVRHFFHRPSKAYTTGTRKRRKVHTGPQGGETRWHKTGKTRPVFTSGTQKGYKKILVLYTNYGKQKKPEKTNWVMHQYHLGSQEEEKDGELVVSKVFYQTQPRQCAMDPLLRRRTMKPAYGTNQVEPYDEAGSEKAGSPQLIPNFSVEVDASAFLG